ncbi:hypothetical protein UFOVP1313_29 [uncultured Caudovirales phage]|uniref:Uncharacterized protein n=1 Tax=uncultured Caudovirales phage TaxID=2100421 RepID=A0A6J5RK30_9CAUD|nr:hypothetical protein UFOVP1313_29 [uncultured Caudovirales phage]
MKTGARKSGEPEVMGASEAAEAIGVRQVNLRTLKGLPEPYGRIRSTTLWRAEEIREFAKNRVTNQPKKMEVVSV